MRRFLVFCIAFAGAIFLFLIVFLYSVRLPNIIDPNERRVVQSTKIYDRTGEILLYDVHGEEKRTVVPFENVPRHVKNATLAIEDDNFYKHYGFRPLAFLRALLTNIFTGSFEQGGSTITQQVVKNTLLTREKRVWRKIKEIFLAIKLERIYSKDEILNIYLNQIPYGSGAYGIEAAAETFFEKHAEDLTILEAAYLASLPKAPSYYSPYGKRREDLDQRASYALKRMFELGFIGEDEYKKNQSEKINFAPQRQQGIIAPHFVFEIIDELQKKFGRDSVESSGLKVVTTLEVDLQKKAEEIINKFSEQNEKNFNAKNAGLVAIDPKTGDVLAMVGSRDYFDAKNEGNFNITTAHRQPGSAFKPFVYATALKNGYTGETVLFDVPTEFNPACTPEGKPTWVEENSPKYQEELKKCYHPQNFDEKFRGPVTLRDSIAQSLNVPSVKVLYLAGLENSLATARDFGITSLNDPERYGLTLVLGGGEMSLLELASAYGTFASDGIRNPYRYILKINDAENNNIFSAELNPTEVIDSNIARTINDMISDNKARAPSFGEFSALYFPGKKVAAKTGTTNDFRDAWVLGYTPDIVIGAWSGNNDNSPMEKKVAGFIVAPWWHEIMEYALTKSLGTEFSPPEPLEPQSDKPVFRGEWRGGREFIVDKISGKLATEWTPKDLQDKKVVREVHSILYWLDRSSSQFKNWEDAVRKWAAPQELADQNESVIPKGYDDVHVPENFPKISKIQINPEKKSYVLEETILIIPSIESRYGVEQADYFANGNYLGSTKNPPWSFSLPLSQLGTDGQVELKLKVYDTVKNSSESSVTINIQG